MWVVWITLILTILLNNAPCDAINCTDVEVERFTKNVTRNTTCEGSVCMDFHFPRTKQIDRTCITTGALTIPTGCIQFDRLNKDLVVCFCDTDLCNSGKRLEKKTIMPEYKCAATFEGTPTFYVKAPLCVTEIVVTDGKQNITKRAETKHENSFVVPITQIAPLESFSFYYNVAHTISGVEKNVIRHFYKCHGDLCNDKNYGAPKVKTDVLCHSSEGDRCQGEFCVFATNGTNLMYCLSTELINTEQQYQTGIFRYKKSTFYLCKENFCNSDEATAKRSSAIKGTDADPSGSGEEKEERSSEENTAAPEPLAASILESGGTKTDFFLYTFTSVVLYLYSMH